MKFTSAVWFKVFCALAPAVLSGWVTYAISKTKTADGYTTLAESVNQLQGAVEVVRTQVQHLQDLHVAQASPPTPTSQPAAVCTSAGSADPLAELIASTAAVTTKARPTLRPKLKAFKRVPMKLDDAKR